MTPSPFKLYWWRRGGRWTNLGDEVSPLILGHVTGREIEHAGLETCDGIAIGSVFYPRKAVRKKRSNPMFIWGSGTLIPRPARFDRLFAILAALRGPNTAGQIENCPEIPFGDPGLFIPEIAPKAAGGAGHIGLIPHHSMLGSPVVRNLRDALGGAEVLDFTNPDFKATLARLSQSRLIVSSSLHGLIFADAYGIPSLFWNEAGAENEWKFRDYFEGAGRQDYAALTAAQITDIVGGGRVDDLPVSLLSAASKDRVLADLRAAAKLMP